MPSVLSSWKEIGQHLGKGVRTVQRWEAEFGLPVRRLDGKSRRAVLAIPAELDAWARSRSHGSGGAVLEAIRSELTALRAETADLRGRMEMIEKGAAKAEAAAKRSSLMRVPARKSPSEEQVEAQAPETIRGEPDDLRQIEEHWVEAQIARAESLRQRLSSAWTMWWTGENGRRSGRQEAAEQSLRRAETVAATVRRHLEEPSYVPKTELKGLQDELRTLQRQIDGTRRKGYTRRKRRAQEQEGAA